MIDDPLLKAVFSVPVKRRTVWGKHIRAATAAVALCFVLAAWLGTSDPGWLNFLLAVSLIWLAVSTIGWLSHRSGRRAGR